MTTSKQGFTKGPWSVVEHSWSDTSVVGPDGTICRISIYDEATEENQAELERRTAERAQLIASAPELCEALAGYMDAVEIMTLAMRDGVNVQGAVSALLGWEEMARAALARAAGEGV